MEKLLYLLLLTTLALTACSGRDLSNNTRDCVFLVSI